MSTIDQLVANNERFADEFDRGDLPLPPARKVALLVCMDARLHPEKFLDLEIGDAHVIRNAGGRASDDAIRSLIISTTLLGTEEFAVIHHTDCGMLTFTNDDMVDKLGEEAGAIDFLPFADDEDAVREDVERIRQHSLIPDSIPVSGYLYDVTTGRLTEVVAA
ncbi:MAG: beta-class carbonic anhydrase [Acidimicrobiales bacterium]